MEDEFFFGTEKDNMDIDQYLTNINAISKYYFESCEKYWHAGIQYEPWIGTGAYLQPCPDG